MNSGILRVVLTLCILLSSAVTHAAGKGWFAGISVGSADDDRLNESETAFKVFAGYRFMKYLSGEIAYIDFGKYFDNTVDRTGVAIQATGIVPVNQHFDIFAKAGAYHWTVEFDLNPGTLEQDGGDFMYGLGAQYNISRRLGIRAEYEEYTNLGDFDISLLSLAAVFNF